MSPQGSNAPPAENPIAAERNKRKRDRLARAALGDDAPAAAELPGAPASDWAAALLELTDRVTNLEAKCESQSERIADLETAAQATAELLLTHSTELEGHADSIGALEADDDAGDGDGNGDDGDHGAAG